MYKVYADDVLIHDSYSPDKIIHLISPNLKLADNAAGSFEMTVPKDNPGYDAIRHFTTTIIIKKDNKTIWTGRVINESEDFWKRRKFTCEGALSFLNDTTQELVYYDNYTIYRFFTAIIDIHNAKAASNRRFRVGTISVTDTKEAFEYKSNYKSTLETINDNFTNRLYGHFRVRYDDNDDTPILDYLADYPNVSSQDINFGSNLLDFTKNWDLSNLVTVILPRGKQLEEENSHGEKEYLTIESVNNGSKYLQNNEAVSLFGRIEEVVDFNDAETPEVLKRLGEIYLENVQFDDMVLNVSAVDLHMLNPDIVSFNLLDQVKCYSAPHGLNKLFPITQIDIPLDSPNNVKYTMGSTQKMSMTSRAAAVLPTVKNSIDISGGNLLANAKHQATELINQKTTGYVNIITENETSQALIISDKPDLETATKLWRWNLNGLGYLNKENNPNGDYTLAITNNGVIVADFIKTGMLEDGYGLNHWNLTTGEFTLAYNTEFANLQGNTITIMDVASLAQDASDTADTAYHKQTGGTNILRGTNKNLKVVTSGNSNWNDGTWDGNLGTQAEKSIIDVTGTPSPSITKAFKIISRINNAITYIVQRNVEVAPNQVYTISCYAQGDASKIRLGYRYNGQAVDNSDFVNPLTTTWRRYSATFKVDSGKTRVDIVFGIEADINRPGYICGMKLERGNTASDWSESEWDTYGISTAASADYTDATADELKTYTKEYTDTISENDRAFTQSQRKALDESFTQYKVLQRLTNNFRAKGIYLQNNELYMNATYVRTGTLDAGIVKTGILTDSRNNNKWNMATGYLYTKNMEAVNMRASGRFECGDSYKLVMGDGTLDGYQGNTWVGSIDPTSNVHYIPTGQNMRGMTIRGKDIVEVRSPKFAVRNRNDNGISINGVTKRFEYTTVTNIWEVGQGGWSASINTHGLDIINGLVVAAW